MGFPDFNTEPESQRTYTVMTSLAPVSPQFRLGFVLLVWFVGFCFKTGSDLATS